MIRTAVICIGGGMRSAHSAGFLYAMAAELDLRYPDMVVGSSGGAGNLLYFATQKREQLECMKRTWTELLSTSKFISYRRFYKVMDVDYLVDIVFKKTYPLDTAALPASHVEYYIAVVDAQNGKVRFITKEDKVDVFELLRATKALPYFYGREVSILGEHMIDGSVAHTLQSHIDFAVSLGANRILVIDDSSPRTILRKITLSIYARTTPHLRKAVVRYLELEPTHNVPENVKILYLRKDALPVSVIGKNKGKLKRTFEQGIQDALVLRTELEAMFGTTTFGVS